MFIYLRSSHESSLIMALVMPWVIFRKINVNKELSGTNILHDTIIIHNSEVCVSYFKFFVGLNALCRTMQGQFLKKYLVNQARMCVSYFYVHL